MLSTIDPRQFRLTRHDDQIYSRFREVFPKLKIDVLDENELKSAEGKQVNIHMRFARVVVFYLLSNGEHSVKNFESWSTIITMVRWYGLMHKESIQVKIPFSVSSDSVSINIS